MLLVLIFISLKSIDHCGHRLFLITLDLLLTFLLRSLILDRIAFIVLGCMLVVELLNLKIQTVFKHLNPFIMKFLFFECLFL